MTDPSTIVENRRASTSRLKRVLVVDDEPDTVDTLTLLLGAMGYDARGAYSGRQAIDMATDFRPMVVVLDIDMPDMDGYQAASELRRRDRGIKLLALTGSTGEQDRASAREAGFDAYLIKSLAAGDIVESVERLTNSA